MSVFNYAITKAGFETAHADWASSTSPVYRSVVFTQDGYLYTHGKYFRLFGDATSIFTASRTNNNVTLSDANGKALVTFDIGISAVTDGSTPVSVATDANGIATVTHDTSSLVASTLGATAASADSIVVPKIVTDAYGHLITGSTQFTATLNQVRSTASTTNTNFYLTFASGSDTQTSELYKASGVYVNPSTNALYATTIYQGGTSLAGLYAPIAHASSATTYGLGTAANYGHLKLSDSITDNTSSTGSGTAATPKAIYDALTSAKSYADSLTAANDAMVFKGTIAATGVITSGDANVNGKTLSQLTGYSAGWTFRVGEALTITGVGVLEIGDIVICVKDYATAYAATDWTAIQVNIDGSVTSASTLTANQLIVGNSGGEDIKTLAAGTNGQVLKMVGGIPAWATDTDTWRAIKVTGTERLAASSSTALDFEAGQGISLGWNSTTNAVTVAFNGTILDSELQSLNIRSAGTSIGSYSPTGTTDNALNFNGGLVASLASNVFTVQHANSTPAQGSTAVRSFTYDAYGHITDSTVVTALKNPYALTFSDAQETPVTMVTDGSVAQTVKFAPASGDIRVTAALASNVLTYTLGITQRYRPVNYIPNGGSSTAVYNDTTATALTLAAGTNVQITNSPNGTLTFSSTNTWRDIQSASVANTTGVLTASASIGSVALKFGDDFALDSEGGGDINIVWAEIDASGAVTYHT